MLGTKRSIAAVPKTFFGSRSLPALKVFLQGEQLYRRNEFREARGSYERAIALDTNFALAYRRMRGVLRGISGEFDSLSLQYAAHAGDHNHGMTPRDSLLILADSLAAAHIVFAPPFASADWLRSVRRRIAVLQEASRRYPEDPEVWTELGEACAHYGDRIGVSDVAALQSFERALSIDSLYGPAFNHAIDLSIRLRPRKQALALVERYERINPRDSNYIIIAEALRGERIDKIVRDYGELVRRKAGNEHIAMLGRLADDPDVFLALQPARIANTLKSRRDSVIVRAAVGQRLILRGRLREGYAAYDSAGLATDTAGLGFVQGPPHALVLAVAGGMPRVAADSFFARLGSDPKFVWRPLAYAWWYHSGDTLALRRVADGPRDQSTAASADVQGLAAYARGVATTYLLLARRDTAAALALFGRLADSSVGRSLTPIRNDMARVLLARRDFRGAAQLLDSRPTPATSLYYWNIEWSVLRARAAAALGDRARARELYTTVAAMWSRADPELRPVASEAASGIR
jgi:serine/threonine-protein kinase